MQGKKNLFKKITCVAITVLAIGVFAVGCGDSQDKKVTDAIEALPKTQDVTLKDEAKINEAKAEYEKLPEDMQKNVKNADKLKDDLAVIKGIKEAPKSVDEDFSKADAVSSEIKDANGDAAVKKAQSDYDALTDAQKTLVENPQKIGR